MLQSRKYALKPAQRRSEYSGVIGLFLLKREQVQEVPSGLDRSDGERQWGGTWGGNTEQLAV